MVVAVLVALVVPKLGAAATLKKFVTIRGITLKRISCCQQVSNCRELLSPYTGIKFKYRTLHAQNSSKVKFCMWTHFPCGPCE